MIVGMGQAEARSQSCIVTDIRILSV